VKLLENTLLTPKELAVEKVITKVFVKLRSNVIVTNRLRSVFMSKLSRMGKYLSLCGGRKRYEILDKWKDMNWVLTLNDNEIVPSCKKDSAIIVTAKAKCDKLKEDLKDVSKKLKDMTNKCSGLDASSKQLLAYRSGASTKRKRVKSWPEYSIQYKRKKIKTISKSIDGVLADNEFTCNHIELCSSDTGETVSVDNTGPKPVLHFKQAPKGGKDSLVKKNLYIKEKYNISNEAYHEISMTNSHIPSAYSLQKEAKQMNSKYTIEAVPGNAIGVQQSLQKKLTERLQHLVW